MAESSIAPSSENDAKLSILQCISITYCLPPYAGIRTNVVAPGWVETKMIEEYVCLVSVVPSLVVAGVGMIWSISNVSTAFVILGGALLLY
jgi:NAD(P)-dependent dehydrogenase (short-subunit alcohol dehydrogenase family)